MTKQTAGDGAVLVAAGGAVTVTTGLSMTEAQEIFRLMLKDSLAGIQAEAYQIAEQRNEKLLSDFLVEAEARFGEHVEEKLAGFRDPGAQFALRHAQSEYCKYGSESGEADAIELLISRLDDSGIFSKTVIIDEAIKLCGKLSSRQIELACLIHMLFKTVFGGMGSDKALGEFFRAAARYADGVNCTSSELHMLEHAGVLRQFTQTKHWLPLSDVMKSRYTGLLLAGESKEYFGVPSDIQNLVLATHVRDPTKFQPNHVSLDEWKNNLIKLGVSSEDAEKIRQKAGENILSKDEIIKIMLSHAPELKDILPVFEDEKAGEGHELRNYDLSPVGRALALARTRRDGWKPEIDLRSLL